MCFKPFSMWVFYKTIYSGNDDNIVTKPLLTVDYAFHISRAWI